MVTGYSPQRAIEEHIIATWLDKLISPTTRATFGLRVFGWRNIPMMLYVRPSVIALSPQRIVVRLPLNRRNRNHWGSMYFGALSVGADCAIGLLVMELIARRGRKISLIFKDCHAQFHKRAMGAVDFSCEQGDEIAALIEQAISTGERVDRPIQVIAHVPSLSSEPVASYTLTLSLKLVA